MIKIPAIDIIDGKVVRLLKGDFAKLSIYDLDIFELVKSYEKSGAKRLHIVDLDAARGKSDNRALIYELVKTTNMSIQIGGGIRNTTVLKECLENGVSSCIVGSLAVKNPELVYCWLEMYGPKKIIVGADVSNGFIATDAWLTNSEKNIEEFIREYVQKGARTFLCTDISLDGTLQGTSMSLYKRLMKLFPEINLIASGGVGSLKDISDLKDLDIYGVVIGKALLERKFTVENLYSC